MSTPRARRTVPGLPDPGRCLVMGVVNVTADSFSDGGLWLDPDDAIRHGLELAEQGADIVDVGGESTRPGALRIDAAEELRRVESVIGPLAEAGVVVSVDTMRAEVAERAVQAGARLINDVSGGRADPDVLRVAADAGVAFVVMHWREHSQTMQNNTHYVDVLADIVAEMRPQLDAALAAGIDGERIVIDPGLGFSKKAAQNWTVLHGLDALHDLGHPLLVAASRKRFLGELLAEDGALRPTSSRESATVAATALAAAAGSWCVRAHEVSANADAVRTAERWLHG